MVSEVLHNALDAPIAPTGVLRGDLDDEGVTFGTTGLGRGEIPILRRILHRHELPVTGVDRFRRDEGCKLHQELTTELAARIGEAALLLRRVAEPFALGVYVELFPKDFVFLKEIFDDKLLLTIHPARQHRQKEYYLRFQAGYARHA